jgi:Leucine-rich repeat (LRR) protein
MKPLSIDVCDQGLEDAEILKLCGLLNSELFYIVERLTLRRNKIKDPGAKGLSKFIAKNPPSFTYLEISRNEITEAGADEMLKALKKNTRLETLLFEYGNSIKNP